MKRVTTFATFFGAILLVTAGMVVAQEPIEQPQVPTEQPQEPAERPQHQMQEAERTFSGEIITVNEDAKTVTVKESGPAVPPTRSESAAPPAETPGAAGAENMKTFHVDTQTEIRGAATTQYQEPQASPGAERPSMSGTGNDELELQDLSEGDRVTVKYTEDAGKSVAKSIQVISRQSS